jgi:hypothetical protein
VNYFIVSNTAYSIQHTAKSEYSSEIIVQRFQLNSSTVRGVNRTVQAVIRRHFLPQSPKLTNIYRQLPGEDYKFLAYDTSNPYIDNFGGLRVGVRYYAFYVINEVEVGLQSNIAEISI